jgi:hypothetical protein
MTERQGEFTVPTRLYLSPQHRVQLEHVVREQDCDLADLVSRIVADYLDASPSLPAPPEQPSQHTGEVPTRLYLTPQHRAQMEHLGHEQDYTLADLVSQIVAGYLDTLPVVPVPSTPASDRSDELRRHRSELARLRAKRDAAGPHAPAWLNSYIADLEAEIGRLEK